MRLSEVSEPSRVPLRKRLDCARTQTSPAPRPRSTALRELASASNGGRTKNRGGPLLDGLKTAREPTGRTYAYLTTQESTPRHLSKRNICVFVPEARCENHYSQQSKLHETQMSVHTRMAKTIVTYLYEGMPHGGCLHRSHCKDIGDSQEQLKNETKCKIVHFLIQLIRSSKIGKTNLWPLKVGTVETFGGGVLGTQAGSKEVSPVLVTFLSFTWLPAAQVSPFHEHPSTCTL